MKRFTKFLVVLMVMLTISCGTKEDPNIVELNMDNYAQYLSVRGGYEMTGKSHRAEQKGTVYDSATLYVSCAGDSNFNFYDTTITIKADGKYYPWKAVKSDYYGLAAGTVNEWIEEEFTFTLDNNGSGEASGEVKFIKPTADLSEHFNKVSFSVVAVSGKVAPAK